MNRPSGLHDSKRIAAGSKYYSAGKEDHAALNGVPNTIDGYWNKSICGDPDLWTGVIPFQAELLASEEI